MDEIQNIQSSGKSKKTWIILLALLLVGSAVSNFFLWNKEQKSTAFASSRLDSLNTLQLLKDSLFNELAVEQDKVANLRLEIAIYQGNNDSLLDLLREKEQKIASLRNALSGGGSVSSMRALKDSLSKFRNDNISFIKQVDSLNEASEVYKAKLLEQENQIAFLEKQKTALSNKVDIAAQPNVGPVMVVPQYEKKGVYLPIFKAKKVERLQISFDVLGNKLTEKQTEKEYIVRIKNPDGIILSNDNSQLMDIDDVYTYKEKVIFNGTQQKIKHNFIQKPEYKKGKYTVELKEGKEVKNTFSFELI
jgi:hypothetical protein